MASDPDTTIIIQDDESPVQGGARPQRAPRPDYSYQDYEFMIDDAAASAIEDGATPSGRKRKRDATQSFTQLLEMVGGLHNELDSEAQRLREELCTFRRKTRKLEQELGTIQEELRIKNEELETEKAAHETEKEQHQHTMKALREQRLMTRCKICFEQQGLWWVLSCGHMVCEDCATHPMME
ncbi:hypothetical protein BJY01DRAFT_247509, partial [Aspergillus pseudoustus]